MTETPRVQFAFDAPVEAHHIDELTKGDGHATRNSAYDYYKVAPYWM